MVKRVPEWRLMEIRNIAEVLAYSAARCEVNRFLVLAEEKYLKPNTRIRLRIHPGMKAGQVDSYVQCLKGAKYAVGSYPVDLYEVTIYFNGDLSTRKKWDGNRRAVVRELGGVIFFSSAANRIEIGVNEEAFLKVFVDAVMKEHPFTLGSARPRFRLVKLQQIVEEVLSPKAREVLSYVPKLLRPYLGPDGW